MNKRIVSSVLPGCIDDRTYQPRKGQTKTFACQPWQWQQKNRLTLVQDLQSVQAHEYLNQVAP